MSNFIDTTGLNIEALTDIITALENGFKDIYGANINLGPNSPDAQMINLFAQAKIDLLECIAMVNAGFDPDQAAGVVLDQRVAINGIKRKGSTFTRTSVTVTTDRIVALPGKDTSATPFTISDGSGTKFVLETSTSTIVGANSLIFAALDAGNVESLPSTLTTIETITLGVLSVTNPSSPITQGIDEETDPQLKVRRRQSVSLPAIGALDATQAAIFQVPDVLDAIVYENVGASTDSNGVPGHSIWAIVDGGLNADIGQAIYAKRNAGCGMKGVVQVPIMQVNGVQFLAKFDRPVYENLFVALTITSIDPTHTIDDEWLKNKIFEEIMYRIYQPADYTAITTLVKTLDPLAVVTAGGVSKTAGGYVGFIYPTTIQNRFIMSTTRIAITVV
jgi:uncharacterized phage protein gp47/JayE